MKYHTVMTFVSLQFLSLVALAGDTAARAIQQSIDNDVRTSANIERDEARKPAAVLEFMSLSSGDKVLDFGAGGGYWTELFSPIVGRSGTVFAHQRPGERFDAQKAAMTEQYSPFGNIVLLPLNVGEVFPLEDESVNAILLSYIHHHLHFSEETPDQLPEAFSTLFSEFLRILKPGGQFVIIEHAAKTDASRAESAAWHRSNPDTARADLLAAGFEFAGDAPGIFMNPDDDLENVWYETGLTGNTTSFVHKYRKRR